MTFKNFSSEECKRRYREHSERDYQTRVKPMIFRKTKIMLGIGGACLLWFVLFVALPNSLKPKLPEFLFISAFLAVFVALVFLILGARAWTEARQTKATLLHIARNAEPVFAVPVMCNNALLSGGTKVAPALVLVSFDPNVNSRPGGLTQLVVTISELAESGGASPEAQFAAALFADEQFRFAHRQLVPATLTGGARIYACHLAIDANHLPMPVKEWLEQCPFLPCMATPGDQGFIEHVPVSFFIATEPGSAGRAATAEDFTQALAIDDPRLAKIKAAAQSDVPRLLELVRQNPGHWIVSAKVPATDQHGTEHLWMNIATIEGQKIHGSIQNDPVTVKTLKIGGAISSTLSEIEDLMVFDSQAKKLLLGGHHMKEMDLLPPELQES